MTAPNTSRAANVRVAFVFLAMAHAISVAKAQELEADTLAVHPFEARQAAETLIDLALDEGNGHVAAGVAAALLGSGARIEDANVWPLPELLEAASGAPETAPLRPLIDRLEVGERDLGIGQIDFEIGAGESEEYSLVLPAVETAAVSTSLDRTSGGGDIDIEVRDADGRLVAADTRETGVVSSATFARWTPENCAEFTVVLANVGRGPARGSLYLVPRPLSGCSQ